MVSSTSRRDRAQLLLIAAIAIAFIILGIAVALNTVLYTQTISSSNTVETADDATQVELELEQGLQTVIQETNRRSGSPTLPAANGADEFAAAYQNRTATSRPSVVAIETDSSTFQDGTMIRQDPPTSISSGRFAFNSTSGDRALGMFVLTIEPGETFDIDLGGDQDIEVRDNSGNITLTFDSGPACEIDPGTNPVRIELLRGTADGEYDLVNCEEFSREFQESYEYIQFENTGGDSIGFEVVIEGDSSGLSPVVFTYESAVWALDADLTYESKELSVDRTIEVDVYGDRL